MRKPTMMMMMMMMATGMHKNKSIQEFTMKFFVLTTSLRVRSGKETKNDQGLANKQSPVHTNCHDRGVSTLGGCRHIKTIWYTNNHPLRTEYFETLRMCSTLLVCLFMLVDSVWTCLTSKMDCTNCTVYQQVTSEPLKRLLQSLEVTRSKRVAWTAFSANVQKVWVVEIFQINTISRVLKATRMFLHLV